MVTFVACQSVVYIFRPGTAFTPLQLSVLLLSGVKTTLFCKQEDRKTHCLLHQTSNIQMTSLLHVKKVKQVDWKSVVKNRKLTFTVKRTYLLTKVRWKCYQDLIPDFPLKMSYSKKNSSQIFLQLFILVTHLV